MGPRIRGGVRRSTCLQGLRCSSGRSSRCWVTTPCPAPGGPKQGRVYLLLRPPQPRLSAWGGRALDPSLHTSLLRPFPPAGPQGSLFPTGRAKAESIRPHPCRSGARLVQRRDRGLGENREERGGKERAREKNGEKRARGRDGKRTTTQEREDGKTGGNGDGRGQEVGQRFEEREKRGAKLRAKWGG